MAPVRTARYDAAMVHVSITRLRIRALRFLPVFVAHTLRSRAQVRRAGGFLGGSLLADRRLTFWTMTGWRSEADLRAYMMAGAHRTAMPRLASWCDEASVVHWSQGDGALPDWREADRRMRAEGRPSRVLHPSAEHGDLSYAAPRTAGAVALPPVRSGRR